MSNLYSNQEDNLEPNPQNVIPEKKNETKILNEKECIEESDAQNLPRKDPNYVANTKEETIKIKENMNEILSKGINQNECKSQKIKETNLENDLENYYCNEEIISLKVIFIIRKLNTI